MGANVERIVQPDGRIERHHHAIAEKLARDAMNLWAIPGPSVRSTMQRPSTYLHRDRYHHLNETPAVMVMPT
jgi:hypothetical protein